MMVICSLCTATTSNLRIQQPRKIMASIKSHLLGLCTVSLLLGVNCQDSLTASEERAVLAKHNKLRGEVTNPTASNMEVMVWNDNLARLAQKHVDMCVFKHNSLRHIQQSDFQYVGENLYASSAQSVNYDAFVQGWYDEAKDYTYETRACTPGKQCGHYTQVVWAKSVELGCAVKRCSSLQIGAKSRSNWIVMVCNYGPTGNFNNQKPYLAGTPCSACPADRATCVANLCTSGSAPSASTSRPASSSRPASTSRPTPPPTIPTKPPMPVTTLKSKSFEQIRQSLETNRRRITVRLNMMNRLSSGRRVVFIRRRFG